MLLRSLVHLLTMTIVVSFKSPIMMSFNNKHIEIDCDFVCLTLLTREFSLILSFLLRLTVDLFTKSHPFFRLQDLVSKVKMDSSLIN